MKNVIDFGRKPEKITPYNFGDQVTRENFIHFFILSYAVSRGSFIIQKVFFIMMESKIGFPYEVTIANFYHSGSFDSFSKEEQDIFIEAFRGVKKHFEKYDEIEIEDEIKDEVDGLFDRPKENGSVPLAAALNFFSFDQIKSVPDFIKVASEFNQKYEDSLN